MERGFRPTGFSVSSPRSGVESGAPALDVAAPSPRNAPQRPRQSSRGGRGEDDLPVLPRQAVSRPAAATEQLHSAARPPSEVPQDPFATGATLPAAPARARESVRRLSSIVMTPGAFGQRRGSQRKSLSVHDVAGAAQQQARRRSTGGWQGPPQDVVQGLQLLRDAIDTLWRKAEPLKPAAAGAGGLGHLVVDSGLPRADVRQAAVHMRRCLSQLSRTVLAAFAGGRGSSPLGAGGSVEHSAHGFDPRDLVRTCSTVGTEPASPAARGAQVPLTRELLGSAALHGLLAAACRELRAERATVFMHTTERESMSGRRTSHLVSVAATGSLGRPVPTIRVQPQFGVAGQVFQTGLALNMRDTTSDSAKIFTRGVDQRTGFHTRNMLCLPLRVPEDCNYPVARVQNPAGLIGVVQLLNKLPAANGPTAPHDGFSEADECRLLEHSRLLSRLLGTLQMAAHEVLAHSNAIQSLIISAAEMRADPERILQPPPATFQLTLTEAEARLQRARAHAQRLRERAAQIRSLEVVPVDGDTEPGTLVCRLGGPDPSPHIVPLTKKDKTGMAAMREVSLYIDRVEECWRSSRNQAVKLQNTNDRLKLRLHQLEFERMQRNRLEQPVAMGEDWEASSAGSAHTEETRGTEGTRGKVQDPDTISEWMNEPTGVLYQEHRRRRSAFNRCLSRRDQMAEHMRGVASGSFGAGGGRARRNTVHRRSPSAASESLFSRPPSASSPEGRAWSPASPPAAGSPDTIRRDLRLRHARERDAMLARHAAERAQLLGALAEEAPGAREAQRSPPPWEVYKGTPVPPATGRSRPQRPAPRCLVPRG
eukprot:TRINITY_DN9386_c0_g1_i1.p1 TRINITY_DN9386_c0_g1~~TRINITY_DN9386_c0_g1_i1.p1  ORF type:complete len:845 (+),score=227.03 TRINITY_DN9386_c0_g1_i1:72-2537(+)